ncbi:MAG: XdhC family protein [Asticcacaulis sp.]
MSEVIDIAPPHYADYVLEDLLRWREEGQKTALLTLVRIDGSSPRPAGSQIAVAADGRATGAITGGCVEQTLVRDALTAMARGQNHVELYGEGSCFRDIVLPCGSGIHVCFDVTLEDARLKALVEARRARRRAVYVCAGPDGAYSRDYCPQPRLIVVGQGHIVPLLAHMATLSEFEVIALSPDEATRMRTPGAQGMYGGSGIEPGIESGWIDGATAVVSLFHDHDYEPGVLRAALGSEAFYIGALGSRATHLRRLEGLRADGWDEAALSRIQGPVGLDIGAKTPPEIALAVMAGVVRAWRQL